MHGLDSICTLVISLFSLLLFCVFTTAAEKVPLTSDCTTGMPTTAALSNDSVTVDLFCFRAPLGSFD